MARQDGRETVHYDAGHGYPACGQSGSVLVTSDADMVESDVITMCGKCMRQLRRRRVMDSTRR